VKITDKQRQHLQALAGGERCSYPGLHLGVLNALSLKGLVAARQGVGSIAMPHTAIKWHITPAGREALSSQNIEQHQEGRNDH
jgi:hypothetical protein